MATLVTGATGLLGNNVVRLLLERGRGVRVLVRTGGDRRPLENLDVEIAQGDLRDFPSLERACRGVEVVIHAAGWVHIGWTGAAAAHEVNVTGTGNLCRAATAAGARMVHVSSINALAVGAEEGPADEDTPRQGQIPCPYMVTKREGEAVVRRWVERGLHAPIVNPGFMLGPWDWKPSSGRMLLQLARRFIPVAPRGGCTTCDVRDVAAGVLAAAEVGRPGRNYILGGENLTYLDLWRLLARAAGRRGPIKRAAPVADFLGARISDAWTRMRRAESDINSASLKVSAQFHYYTSQRAMDELGYRFRPPAQTAADAWRWFRDHGYA